MRILIVEDDTAMRTLLSQGLEREGHAVVLARDGEEALDFARGHPFDVIVLDIMLPKLDGFSVSRRLRQGGNRTPVLMLTARDQMPDVVMGLDSGADDYLIKPFSFEILLARLRAVSRRGPIPRGVRLKVGDLELDTGTREAWRSGRKADLTRTEYSLLEFLMRRPGQVVSREAIFEAVWEGGANIETNTLDAFVRLLRSKIEPAGTQKILWTVHGVGYTLREEAP